MSGRGGSVEAMGEETTRIPHLDDHRRQLRQQGDGDAGPTSVLGVQQFFRERSSGRPRPSHFEVFQRTWPCLYQRARSTKRPGVAVALFDPEAGRVETAILRAQDAGDAKVPGHLVVGHHPLADLHAADTVLGLRHAVLIDVPGEPAYRLVDLASLAGTRDADGDALRAARVQGFGAFELGRSYLHAVPLEAARALPPAPEAAWARLPEPGLTMLPRTGRRDGGVEGLTVVDLLGSTGGPAHSTSCSASVRPVAELCFVRVGQPKEEGNTVPVYGGMLREGILLGRYDRCDAMLGEQSLSRMHALVLRLCGEVYLLDLASVNGCYWEVDGPGEEWDVGEVLDRRRVFRLDRPMSFLLGATSRLYWTPR
ncbi:MAG: FHA domain-containing protein [Deltaproteobacteria bacterium]|nr:MAG: FHA domain-containing protein [Deltaproteobacteria bacterium]